MVGDRATLAIRRHFGYAGLMKLGFERIPVLLFQRLAKCPRVDRSLCQGRGV